MKIKVMFGLGLLPLLVVVALRHNGNPNKPSPQIEPATVRFQPDFSTVGGCFAPVSAQPVVSENRSAQAILLASIEAETDPDRRSEALLREVNFVSDKDLPTMLDSLTSQTSRAAGELRELLLRHWAENNPVSAANWLAQFSANSANSALFEQVAIAWANTDLPAAAAWAHALSDSQNQQIAILALAYEAARTEPIAALKLARTLPATSERDNLLVHAVSQWAADDSAAAAAWAEKVSDPILRQQLLAAVAVAFGKLDGNAAATFAVSALDPGELQDRTAVAIVQRWGQAQPQEAASWIGQFPAGAARDAATENLLALQTAQLVKPGE